MTPTIGRIVWYRSNRGLGYQVPAIVTVTPDTYVAGPQSMLPPLAAGEVHLWVFGPDGGYREFNVRMGDGEREWQWPPHVAGADLRDLTGQPYQGNGGRLAIPTTPSPRGRPGPVVEVDLEELATLVEARIEGRRRGREVLAGPPSPAAGP